MTDLEKLEGRVVQLESGSKILAEIQATVDLIYGAIATEPGGKQGLIDGHRSLGEKVSAIETKVNALVTEQATEKEKQAAEKKKFQEELTKLKIVGATAYGGLVVLVWVLEHGSALLAALKHP